MAKLSDDLMVKIKRVRGVIFDCDGIMTDGQILYNGNEQWVRFFNILDGMGVKRLQAKGLKVGMITNSDSDDIRARCRRLGIEDLYEGVSDKTVCLTELSEKWGMQMAELAYMGDDLQDIPVLEKVGFAVTVPHALDAVKNNVDLVTQKFGGHGAVREFCELILETQYKQ